MRKLILIATLSLAILLAGASVVLAQSTSPGYGHRMMQAPAAGTTTNPDQAPPQAQKGVCPLAGQGAAQGMMGNGMMGGEDMQAAHDAMQNGNWDAMRNACQKAWEKNQNNSGSQNQPSSTAAGRTSRAASV